MEQLQFNNKTIFDEWHNSNLTTTKNIGEWHNSNNNTFFGELGKPRAVMDKCMRYSR